jgi:hypothetical protein
VTLLLAAVTWQEWEGSPQGAALQLLVEVVPLALLLLLLLLLLLMLLLLLLLHTG